MTIEKQLTASIYTEVKHRQICGVCGCTEFKDMTVIKTGEDTIITARCVRCGEVNDMNPGGKE